MTNTELDKIAKRAKSITLDEYINQILGVVTSSAVCELLYMAMLRMSNSKRVRQYIAFSETLGGSVTVSGFQRAYGIVMLGIEQHEILQAFYDDQGISDAWYLWKLLEAAIDADYFSTSIGYNISSLPMPKRTEAAMRRKLLRIAER